MSFKQQIRKPIVGVTFAATTMLGAGCGGEVTPEAYQPNQVRTQTTVDTSTMSNFEDCVTEHSQENYRFNNVVTSFGEEMAGQITVATCAAIESCPENDSPSEILAQVVASGGAHASEAAAVLADPSNGGLIGLDELRSCAQMRVYDEHGIDELVVTGQSPMWFINRYPSTPDMPIAE